MPTIRALYKRQRDAMVAALQREMKGLDVQFNAPVGGMFLWARLPEGIDTVALLPKAVERNVAFVPGAPFYAGEGDPRTLRLSFVTASVDRDRHRHRRAGRDAVREQRCTQRRQPRRASDAQWPRSRRQA